VLSAFDYFTTDRQVMIAFVPIHGVRTIYAAIGELYAWLCLGGLLALIVLAVVQKRKRRYVAEVAIPQPEAQATR
jgi:apolipoprotein N-acyltransferase